MGARYGRTCGHTDGVNLADWIALAVVALTAVSGFRRGFVTGVLSLAGLIVGAIVGAVVPDLVGSEGSEYVPLIALAGAAVGGMFGQYLGVFVGGYTRRTLSILPPLRMLDTAGGIALGAVTGLAICWAIGAVLLYVPGQSELRRLAQESVVVSTLTDALPPSRVIDAVERIDPFTSIVGPVAGVERPTSRSRVTPTCSRRRGGRSCRCEAPRAGSGSRSGWIVRPGLVVTNAHVAGISRPVIDRRDGKEHSARVVSFDARNDLAILRVSGLEEEGAPARGPGARASRGRCSGSRRTGAQSDARSSGPGGDDQLPRRVRTPGVGPAGRRPARRRPQRELGRADRRRRRACSGDDLCPARRARRTASPCRTTGSASSRTSGPRSTPPASRGSQSRGTIRATGAGRGAPSPTPASASSERSPTSARSSVGETASARWAWERRR